MSNSKSNVKPSLEEVHGSVRVKGNRFWRKVVSFFGPAYLISVGYMDPGNWATDIAGGSKFGYTLIWVLLMSNLMALVLQSLSARLGIVNKRDLAQASRETYPKFINYILYFLAEIAIVATDLAEVLGMAIGLQLLFDIPLMWGVSITVIDTFLLLFLISKGMRKMEAFIIVMISIIGLSFLAEIILAKPDMVAVSKGLIPSLPDQTALYIAIGIIGATIMPHNLYLHSSLVQTRRFKHNRKGIKQALKFNFFDTLIALNLAFLVNASILILASSTFHDVGMVNVSEIQDAHQLLSPLLGTKWAGILFAVALIAAGQSSTITGTLAGQIVMEGYLKLRIQQWVRRLITRSIAIFPALLTIYFFGEESTGNLLILSQVILSLQLGFAIIPLIYAVGDKSKMKSFAIGLKTKIMAWLITLIIVSLNIKLVLDELMGWLESSEHPILIWLFAVLPTLGLFLLLIYITINPLVKSTKKHTTHERIVPHDYNLTVTLPHDSKYFENIAVAVDFSKADKDSITTALQLAKSHSKITLIHIVESPAAFYFGKRVRDLETSIDKLYLSKYKAVFLDKGYKINAILEFGIPNKMIPKVINSGDFDVLVMGTHGHRTFKDLVFGTTVKNVRHNISIPLMIVKVKK